MKIKIIAVAAILIVGALFAQPVKPSIRIAQEEGTEVWYSWTPADPDFTIIPNQDWPDGFEVARDGNDVLFHMTASEPNVYPTTITVSRNRLPVANWTGAAAIHRETTPVEWVVYRSSLDPFFGGFGDVVVYPSGENQ